MTVDLPDYMPESQAMGVAFNDTIGQLAALIATGSAAGAPGGVPLLGLPVELYNVSNQNLPANTAGTIVQNSQATNLTDMGNYLTYDVHGRMGGVGGEPSPFTLVHMKWFLDPAGTVQTWADDWCIPTAVGSVGFLGAGPVRGRYLEMTIDTTGSTNAATLTSFQLAGTSRPYPGGSADWRTFATNTPIGFAAFTAGLGDTFDCLLGGVTPGANNIAVGTTKYCCGLYNGAVNVVANTALVNLAGVTLIPSIFVPGIGLTQIGGVLTFAAAAVEFSLSMPHYPLVLHFNSTAGGALSCDFNVNGTGRSF